MIKAINGPRYNVVLDITFRTEALSAPFRRHLSNGASQLLVARKALPKRADQISREAVLFYAYWVSRTV